MNVKLRRVISIAIIIMALLITLVMTIPNAVSALEMPLYLGIVEVKTNDTPNLGYAIGNADTNNDLKNINKIWNIVEYTGKGQTSSLKADGEKNIYSLKAGIGFTNIGKRDEYTMSFNMKTQKNEIAMASDTLKTIAEGTVPYINEKGQTVQVSKYNSILALGDMLYLINDNEDIKTEYLNKAGIKLDEPYEELLTRDEISAIQQAAMWYFTNYEEDSTKFDKIDESGWFWYTDNGTTYQVSPKQEQAEKLYKYLINTAKQNASKYENFQETSEAPAVLGTKNLEYKEKENNYILGPITITEQIATIPYTIDFSLKADGSTIDKSEYKILNANEIQVEEGTTVKDLVGQNFYISVPKTKGKTFSISTKIGYSNTALNLYTAPGNTTQPVLIPEKKQSEIIEEISTQITVEELFDLKLVKRITAVNDKPVQERLEKVDISKLNTVDANGKKITTGNYTLSKSPVGVKKDDIVTYTFRIYNEGTIDGYASKITEEIPEGLEFLWSGKTPEELKEDSELTKLEKEAIEFNQEYLWGNFEYDEATREKIVKISTDYLSKENETTRNGNLIKAFGENDGTKTEKDISYKEVSVKMKVTSEDVAGTIIKNDASITEDTDSKGEPIDDRDSKTDIFARYEDDEDYDNITLQTFDLALRKFIIAVSKDETIENNEYLRNDDGSYQRAPVVDTSKLNTTGADGRTIANATYNHSKKPLLVEKGDNIVYMIRIYNEGDVDGYVSEIKEYLPQGLEFVDNEFNKKYDWKLSEDGKTVTTSYLNESLIKKSETVEGKHKLSYKEVPIMCKVKDTAPSNKVIASIAEITKYEDGNREKILDRDLQDYDDCEVVMIEKTEPSTIEKITRVINKWLNIN